MVMDTREFKGLELAARAKIEWRKTYWYVPSASHEGGYKVDCLDSGDTCTCEDYELRRQPCKHIFAIRIVRERNRGTPLPVQDATAEQPEQTPPKKRTYRQKW